MAEGCRSAMAQAAHWGTVHAMQGKGHPSLGLQSPLLANIAAKLIWPCSCCPAAHVPPGALAGLAVGKQCRCCLRSDAGGGWCMFLPAHPWDMLWLSHSHALAACSAALLFVCQQAPACTHRSGRDLENSMCLCIESEMHWVPNPASPLARASPHLYAEHAPLSFRSCLQCFPP